MALSVKVKKKKSRVGAKSLDEKLAGPEPIVVDFDNLVRVYNWYNYLYTVDTAKEWILQYMKTAGYTKADIAAVRRAPKNQTSTTAGWLARISMNGNTLPESSLQFLQGRIQQNIQDSIKIPVEEEDAEKPVINIQERIREKANYIITSIEEEIDNVIDDKEFSMYTFCQANELTPQILSIIADYYRPQWEEILSNDEQVKESYGKKQKFWINFWNSFFADIDRYINNKKATKIRKPREKKAKSAIDLVKNLKYQKEEPSLKLVSVHPAEIIGCSQLWVYNTKYRKLIQYNALGPSGIQVKGTTLTGWDTESSISKTLRKPEQHLTDLLSAGKVSLRRFMSNIKSIESKPNGRTNEATILLRIIK